MKTGFNRGLRCGALGLQVLCVLASCVAAPSSAEAREQSVVVRTQDGWLRGSRADGVDRFLAIPYAAPPVGPLRWKPPKPAAPWWGIRSAETLPPPCAQIGAATGGKEDCLYLNVIRPTQPRRAARLPVVFYIHGGGFKVGSSFDNDPTRISRSTDSVVVMINYRLGQFGFLAHPALGAEAGDGTSGEYGLLDQQAALRWVHDQIGAFGGDPRKVTIVGGSAGGWSVCAHLTSQPVRELFSGAVIQSGECVARPLADAESLGMDFARAVGCPDAASSVCLREKSTAELIASDSWAFGNLPVSGGRVLPEAPIEAVRAGRFSRVPVVVGGTRNEARQALTSFYPMTEESYVSLTDQFFGDDAAAVRALYPSSAFPEPFDAFAEAANDSYLGSCALRELARTFARSVPTYVYEFDDPNAPAPTWVSLPPGMKLGSSHGSDEVYWFDRPFDSVAPLNWQQRFLAYQMIQYLGAFAERGAPQAWPQPAWPRFENERERVLRFQPGAIGVRTDFGAQHHCEFWSALGYNTL